MVYDRINPLALYRAESTTIHRELNTLTPAIQSQIPSELNRPTSTIQSLVQRYADQSSIEMGAADSFAFVAGLLFFICAGLWLLVHLFRRRRNVLDGMTYCFRAVMNYEVIVPDQQVNIPQIPIQQGNVQVPVLQLPVPNDEENVHASGVRPKKVVDSIRFENTKNSRKP